MWTSELSSLAVLRAISLSAAALAIFALARALLRLAPVAAPLYGLRGKRRDEARESVLFGLAEPVIAQLAAWLQVAPLARLRARLVLLLRHASEPAGWSADELMALSLLSLCSLGGAALWLVHDAELGSEVAVFCLLLSAALPIARVHGHAKLRAKLLERSLPAAMDLCVLCMGAGADFPGALRFVVEELGGAHAVCRQELGQVLDELSLGRTRAEALAALATRSSSVAVREFVAAIRQSEQKGTPLIDVLTIQATTLRQRRSVRAEELAAQAGVKMMAPLMLLVTSLLLIIFGPIITTGTGL